MITIVDVDKLIKENHLLGPITSPQTFLGKSYAFHPEGVHSEEIFGIEGSQDRKERLSWIELNTKIIHPVLYNILSKRMLRKLDLILSGETRFTITEEGELVEDKEKGEITGMDSFSDNINKIRFRAEETEEKRTRLANMLYNNIKKGIFFTSKLIVISPDFRPIQIMEDKGKVLDDPMNTIYQKVIRLSKQLAGTSGFLYDILSYKMQLMIQELFEFIRVKTSKKEGMIRKSILGKRVDFSARSVITPNPKLRLGEVGIPLKICCSIFEPNLIYGLANSKKAKDIPEEFHVLVREFLGKETETYNF